MLRRVAVFAGGWTLAGAEEVCAGDGIDASDVIEQLASLVDKSLVVPTNRRA
jgi:predicted ATPase